MDVQLAGPPAEQDDDHAGLARELESPLPAASADPARLPREEGPRRGLLVGLAVGAGLLLLWMLFRSVPAEKDTTPARSRDQNARSVQEMANEADPSWMRTADASGPASAGLGGEVVPPVYGPKASGAPAEGSQGAVPDTVSGVDSGSASAVPVAVPDPRRERFVAALQSKPLQGGGSYSAGATPAGAVDAIAPPPTLAEMEAAAQAEAERRSIAPAAGGTFSAGDGAIILPSAPSAQSPPATGRPSQSLSGGSGEAPRATAAHVMRPRASASGVVVVPMGTIIEGQLHTAVVSERAGSVVGMVTRNVYDAHQRVIVIPRYSWLFGSYDVDVAIGQRRLDVQWTAVRFPTGDTYDLPGLAASDPTGASGLPARVNNHYGRVFGQALLSSVIAGGFEIAAGDASRDRRSAQDVLTETTAQQLGQTASEVTRRNLGIKPTLTVGPMTRFSIVLDRDLVFTPASR